MITFVKIFSFWFLSPLFLSVFLISHAWLFLEYNIRRVFAPIGFLWGHASPWFSVPAIGFLLALLVTGWATYELVGLWLIGGQPTYDYYLPAVRELNRTFLADLRDPEAVFGAR